jgi:hypothetical protein
MNRRYQILGAVAMLAGGLLLGRQLRESRFGDRPESPGDTSRTSSPRSRGDRPDSIKAQERPMDLAAIRARLSSIWNEGHGARELERLSAGQLRDLITELAARSGSGGNSAPDLMNPAAMELYKREGLAAADWITATIPEGAARRSLLGTVISLAAREHPESAKPWITRLEADYGRDAITGPMFNAVQGATARGAEDLVRLVDLFGKDYLSRTMIPQGECPPDFDFGTLYSGVVGKVNLRTTVETWATRDADAAWQAVRNDLQTRGKPAAQYFESIMLGLISREGDAAAMAWGVEALKELPQEQRDLCLSGLYTRYSTAQSISAAARSLDPEAREQFASSLISMTAGNARVVGVLETLERDQLLRVLEDAASKNKNALGGTDGSYYSETLRQMFRDTERKFSLTEEEKAKIGL